MIVAAQRALARRVGAFSRLQVVGLLGSLTAGLVGNAILAERSGNWYNGVAAALCFVPLMLFAALLLTQLRARSDD